MSRLVDDIVHYFGRYDIDILKAEARMALLRDNWDMIRSLTSVQSHADLSGSLELALADALLTAEDSDRRMREEVIMCWKEKADLKDAIHRVTGVRVSIPKQPL